MKVKYYKGIRSTGLIELTEEINEWALSGWTLHTFTHQEDPEEVHFSAMLETEIDVEDDD
jgi:hypothetical protein